MLSSPRALRRFPQMIPVVTRIGRATVVLCTGATAIVGCPMYSDDCDSRDDCATGFYCESFSRRCQPQSRVEPVGCTRPDACDLGETCTPNFECQPGSCDYHGCVQGYACSVVDSAHACVANGGDAGADAGLSDGGPGDSGPRDSGPRDSGPRDSGPGDAGPSSSDAGADASL